MIVIVIVIVNVIVMIVIVIVKPAFSQIILKGKTTWIEIFIGDSWIVPDNVKRGLFHHKVGHQGQRGVGRKLTQIGTWKKFFFEVLVSVLYIQLGWMSWEFTQIGTLNNFFQVLASG